MDKIDVLIITALKEEHDALCETVKAVEEKDEGIYSWEERGQYMAWEESGKHK